MKILFKLLCCILTFSLLFFTSCTDGGKKEIIKEYETSVLASESCGIDDVTFVPNGYKAEKYSTLYGIVYECEYRNDNSYSVLRIVPSEYTTSNLSGYTDTLLFEVYKVGETEHEIESREGVFACEFTTEFSGKECDISYVLSGGTADEFKAQLKELVTYLKGE